MHEDVEAGLPFINANSDRLQQAFINVINNALDAMPDGGELTINAHSRVNTDERVQVVVEVMDTGIGMTDEVRTRIFELMFTTKRREQGSGLGLVIVNQVMSEHKGFIEVASAPGKGTRFCLIFPAENDAPLSRPTPASRFGRTPEPGAAGNQAEAKAL